MPARHRFSIPTYRSRKKLPHSAMALCLGTLLTTLATAPTLLAQSGQYTSPGSLLLVDLPLRERLKKEVDEARWNLGGLRVTPWVSLQELSYVDDVFSGTMEERQSDITATFGAGLKAYLPVGSKVTLAAYGLPEYVWWQDLTDRRRLNGRYGAGIYAYFNRLTVEIEALRHEEQTFVSSEFAQLTNRETDAVEIFAELQAFRSLYVFAGFDDRNLRHPLEEAEVGLVPEFNRLDRDEEILRGGLRLRLGDSLSVGVGVEETETDFIDPEADRSSTGDATFVELQYKGGRTQINATIAERTLDPTPGSGLIPFDETTGQIQASVKLRPRLQGAVYHRQGLGYTVGLGFPQSFQERTGLGFIWELGRRTQLTFFSEEGEDEYLRESAAAMVRFDDVTAIGGTIGLQLRPKLNLEIGFSSREYESNFPGLDRSVDQVTTRITLGGDSWP